MKRSHLRRPRWVGAMIGLALLGFSARAAEAGPIRNYQISARGSRDLRVWSSYLTGGSQLWSSTKAPHISGAVHIAMAQALGTPNPRTNPWVQYLLWRHDRNPANFDRWHPQLGPALEGLPPLQTIRPSVIPKPHPHTQTVGKHPRTPRPNVPGILIPPGPTVPEPDALTVSLGLISAGFWWRWRGGLRPARVPD